MVFPPLDCHLDGDLFLFRNSLRELGEVIRLVASLGQVIQNRTAHAPCVLKPSTFNVMRQVLRGGVVQVVQDDACGLVPWHSDVVVRLPFDEELSGTLTADGLERLRTLGYLP